MTKKLQTLISNGIVLAMALFTIFALFFTTVGVDMDMTLPDEYEDFYAISGFEALSFDDTFLTVIDRGGVEVLLGITSIFVLLGSIAVIAFAAFAFVKALMGDGALTKFFPKVVIASLAIAALYAILSIIALIVAGSDVKELDLYTVAFVPLIVEAVLAIGYKVVLTRPTKN